MLGLAPGAHGANRTGRMFTGDSSGMFLMRAMHAAGFANKPLSHDRNDGLELHDAYILAAVRCAPPDNKPTTEEIAACQAHLIAEWDALPRIQVVVALGRLAYDAYWRVMNARGITMSPKPKFGHGMACLAARRPLRDCLVSPQPAEHLHRQADAAMLEVVFEEAARQIR